MNRPLTLTFALMIIASPLLAQDTGGETLKKDDYCEKISEISEAIMESRQRGVSLSNALGTSPLDIVRTIVLDAWESPRYSTESVVQREVDDFRDQWHLVCLKAMRDQ